MKKTIKWYWLGIETLMPDTFRIVWSYSDVRDWKNIRCGVKIDKPEDSK